jgi:hypothetical protein
MTATRRLAHGFVRYDVPNLLEPWNVTRDVLRNFQLHVLVALRLQGAADCNYMRDSAKT